MPVSGIMGQTPAADNLAGVSPVSIIGVPSRDSKIGVTVCPCIIVSEVCPCYHDRNPAYYLMSK